MADKRFHNRFFFLLCLILCLTLLLVGRMYYLQIIEGQHFRSLAEGNRIALKPNLSLRGEIYDRNGVILAQNESTFRISLMKEKGADIERAMQNLKPYVRFSKEEIKKVNKNSKKRRGLEPLVLKDKLTWKEVSRIELNLETLPGLSIEVGHMRIYPKQKIAAHLLGYVSAPSEKEQDADPVLTIPGLQVGKVGIEKQLEKKLRGIPGHKQLEVNANRHIVRELSDHPSIPGDTLKLTIDLRLQDYIAQRLAEHESGSAVVMNVNNGEVIALVSHPSFDPNLFVDGISHANWRSLMDNPYVPLTNKAVGGSYPPGSTLKMLALIAALEKGVVNMNTSFYCPGYFYSGNHKFHCWKKQGHGQVSAHKAVTQSCDVYFYNVAKRLGIEALEETYKKFGMAVPHLIGFPHERSGLVPTRELKKKRTGYHWTSTDTIITIIGQGYLLATPLQLAVVAARLASGHAVEPTLLLTEETPPFPKLDVNPVYLKIAQKAMIGVVNTPGGTAYRHRIETGPFAGKTGTSQVRRITLQERQQNLTKGHHLDWKYQDHGLFIGYYPTQKPRYAIAVVLEHVGGSSHAAKAAKDILIKLQELEFMDTHKPLAVDGKGEQSTEEVKVNG